MKQPDMQLQILPDGEFGIEENACDMKPTRLRVCNAWASRR